MGPSPTLAEVRRARVITRFRTQLSIAVQELFDQSRPFGRLALVQVLMIAGDTLVTISLAGSLFFSISPEAAKSNVLLYLLITIAPFAVVSPLLGPLIDRSQGARRVMVIVAALGRAAVCPFMALHLSSLLLFPAAFVILILSKVYGVTKGALVPEMAAREAHMDDGSTEGGDHEGYAEWNARLTLLGTVAGFLATIPAVLVLKTLGAPAVLYLDAAVFLVGAIAAFRLPSFGRRSGEATGAARPRVSASDRHLATLQPVANPEVLAGLALNSIMRGIAGFLLFLVAFGLRRLHAPLYWYGLVLGASGGGALLGLIILARIRRFVTEQQILLGTALLVTFGAVLAAYVNTLWIQVFLALIVGLGGSLAQPSFDAMAQRYVPEEIQGRAFARFATRQQMVWVIGALVAVVIPLTLKEGDVLFAIAAGLALLGYGVSRIALRGRALPRNVQRHNRGTST